MGWLRPKSGMKNCNLLNRIVPQTRQSLRNFTNESAEKLGAKLCDGHAGTIDTPAIARRNQLRYLADHRSHRKVSSMISPSRGKGLCGEFLFNLKLLTPSRQLLRHFLRARRSGEIAFIHRALQIEHV